MDDRHLQISEVRPISPKTSFSAESQTSENQGYSPRAFPTKRKRGVKGESHVILRSGIIVNKPSSKTPAGRQH